MAKGDKPSVGQGLRVIFTYCWPLLLAATLSLGFYFNEVCKVSAYIHTTTVQLCATSSSPLGSISTKGDDATATSPKAPQVSGETPATQPSRQEELFTYLYRTIKAQPDRACETIESAEPAETAIEPSEEHCELGEELRNIWLSNSSLIFALCLLPFLILSSRLAYSPSLHLSYKERCTAAHRNWAMKLLFAVLLVLGMKYLINLEGVVPTTINQYLLKVDMSRSISLPALIDGFTITPVIAGFLGWYIYLLTYLFGKAAVGDVVSSKVYGLMFRKLLITWGIALITGSESGVSGSADGGPLFENAALISFLVGLFPHSAFSLLKDSGLRVLQGIKEEQGQLTELPGISRWQILRLEEEGISSMVVLAYADCSNLTNDVPSLSAVVQYWVDISRLYAILGHEDYHAVAKQCRTASEWMLHSGQTSFAVKLGECGIGNVEEVTRLLERTFTDLKMSNTAPSHAPD